MSQYPQDKVAGRFSSDLDNLINLDNSDDAFTAFKRTSQIAARLIPFQRVYCHTEKRGLIFTKPWWGALCCPGHLCVLSP